MNFVPDLKHAPESTPSAELRRHWLTITLVALFVSLSVVAVTWHVLDGGSVASLIQPSRPTTPSAGIVEQYTRFRTEKVDGAEVVTGYRYARSTDAAPDSQYCYLLIARKGLDLRFQVALAEKSRDGAVAYHTVSPSAAQELGLAAEEISSLAQRRCRFDEWE